MSCIKNASSDLSLLYPAQFLQFPYPDSRCDERPTGVKLEGVEVGTTCSLRIQEGRRTAKGVEKQFYGIQLCIW